MNLDNFHDQIVSSISALIVRLVGIGLALYGLVLSVSSFHSALHLKRAISVSEIEDVGFNPDQFLIWWIAVAVFTTVLGVFMIAHSRKIGRLLCRGV